MGRGAADRAPSAWPCWSASTRPRLPDRHPALAAPLRPFGLCDDRRAADHDRCSAGRGAATSAPPRASTTRRPGCRRCSRSPCSAPSVLGPVGSSLDDRAPSSQPWRRGPGRRSYDAKEQRCPAATSATSHAAEAGALDDDIVSSCGVPRSRLGMLLAAAVMAIGGRSPWTPVQNPERPSGREPARGPGSAATAGDAGAARSRRRGGGGGRAEPRVDSPRVRIFSGIQPTGRKHLGNYIGAIRQYVEGQDRAGRRRRRSTASSTCTRSRSPTTRPSCASASTTRPRS